MAEQVQAPLDTLHDFQEDKAKSFFLQRHFIFLLGIHTSRHSLEFNDEMNDMCMYKMKR